jgi:hypothetical protein
MRSAYVLAILTGALAACAAPPVRHASEGAGNEAEVAAFLAGNPHAAAAARYFEPICREDTEECRWRIVQAARATPGRSWVALAPAGEGQQYFVDQLVLRERFPLRFWAWVMRSHFPDWANEHGFSLAHWHIDCGVGAYAIGTELEFSRDERVTSARDGERRTIQPPVGSGEAALLTGLCHNRTEHPPPDYRPFDW